MLRMLLVLVACLMFMSDASAFGKRGPGLFGRRSNCSSGSCNQQPQMQASNCGTCNQGQCPVSCGPNGCIAGCQPSAMQPAFNYMPLQSGRVVCGPNGCTTFR